MCMGALVMTRTSRARTPCIPVNWMNRYAHTDIDTYGPYLHVTFTAYNVELRTVAATVSAPAAVSTPTIPAEWSQVQFVRETKHRSRILLGS